MFNKVKCAEQYTVDLINNNISVNDNNVQEECAIRLYGIYIAAIRMMEDSEYLDVCDNQVFQQLVTPSPSFAPCWGVFFSNVE